MLTPAKSKLIINRRQKDQKIPSPRLDVRYVGARKGYFHYPCRYAPKDYISKNKQLVNRLGKETKAIRQQLGTKPNTGYTTGYTANQLGTKPKLGKWA